MVKMSKIIEIENLSFAYSAEKILQSLNLEVESKTFIGIVGPNGVGKTTLLNLVCGLLKPESGNIKVNGKNIESYSARELAQKIAIVRQEFVPIFDFSVLQTVAMARTPYISTLGFISPNDRQIIEEALEATDTTHFAQRSLGSLSGGERQRVFIARALAQNTPVLLLDEPTSFLDMKHQVGIYDLLKTAQLEKEKTIIAVTHDINLATQYCDKILLLTPNNDFKLGTPKEVLSETEITRIFGVKVYSGTIAGKDFYIPLGKHIHNTD